MLVSAVGNDRLNTNGGKHDGTDEFVWPEPEGPGRPGIRITGIISNEIKSAKKNCVGINGAVRSAAWITRLRYLTSPLATICQHVSLFHQKKGADFLRQSPLFVACRAWRASSSPLPAYHSRPERGGPPTPGMREGESAAEPPSGKRRRKGARLKDEGERLAGTADGAMVWRRIALANERGRRLPGVSSVCNRRPYGRLLLFFQRPALAFRLQGRHIRVNPLSAQK